MGTTESGREIPPAVAEWAGEGSDVAWISSPDADGSEGQFVIVPNGPIIDPQINIQLWEEDQAARAAEAAAQPPTLLQRIGHFIDRLAA